jgi:hypothetical protein
MQVPKPRYRLRLVDSAHDTLTSHPWEAIKSMASLSVVTDDFPPQLLLELDRPAGMLARRRTRGSHSAWTVHASGHTRTRPHIRDGVIRRVSYHVRELQTSS